MSADVEPEKYLQRRARLTRESLRAQTPIVVLTALAVAAIVLVNVGADPVKPAKPAPAVQAAPPSNV